MYYIELENLPPILKWYLQTDQICFILPPKVPWDCCQKPSILQEFSRRKKSVEPDHRVNANKEGWAKQSTHKDICFPQWGSYFVPPTEMYISFCVNPTYMHINTHVHIFNV